LDNIGRVIGSVRLQLTDVQEKCCISHEECRPFQPVEGGRYCIVALSVLSIFTAELVADQLFIIVFL